MKFQKVFLLFFSFLLSSCNLFSSDSSSVEENVEKIKAIESLVCINDDYLSYFLEINGLRVDTDKLLVESIVSVKMYESQAKKDSGETRFTMSFDVKENNQHWYVGANNGVELKISRYSKTRGTATVYSPAIIINNLDFVDSLIFVAKDYYESKTATGQVKLQKYYNGDGSLLLEILTDGSYTYDGITPSKEATYTKCYRFSNFTSSDGINYYPKFNEEPVQDVLAYEIIDNSYVSVSCKSGTNIGSIKISSTYFSRPVTKIADSGFRNLDSLIHIEIPTTITEIGNNAFRGCKNLREVVNSDQNIEYGTYVFAETGLREFTLSPYLDAIKEGFFYKSSKLTKFVWNIGGTEDRVIQRSAFDGCSSLLKLECIEYVKEINAFALSGTNSLKYIFLKSNVTIWSRGLSGCSADAFVKGDDTSEIIFSNLGYTGKLRYYSETKETWIDSDDYWHYSEEGYPVSWGY